MNLIILEFFIGVMLKIDWESGDFFGVWKKFKEYIEFMFNGLLKEKLEKEKCNYFMIWVKKKVRMFIIFGI